MASKLCSAWQPWHALWLQTNGRVLAGKQCAASAALQRHQRNGGSTPSYAERPTASHSRPAAPGAQRCTTLAAGEAPRGASAAQHLQRQLCHRARRQVRPRRARRARPGVIRAAGRPERRRRLGGGRARPGACGGAPCGCTRAPRSGGPCRYEGWTGTWLVPATAGEAVGRKAARVLHSPVAATQPPAWPRQLMPPSPPTLHHHLDQVGGCPHRPRRRRRPPRTRRPRPAGSCAATAAARRDTRRRPQSRAARARDSARTRALAHSPARARPSPRNRSLQIRTPTIAQHCGLVQALSAWERPSP